MARKYVVTPVNTYATEENADKAVAKKFGSRDDLVYVIMRTEDGRFFPVFIGRSAAVSGVHFHFNVLHMG